MKNILNCLLHFYLFKSTTPTLLIDLIKQLLNSFTETDLEILIFVLHNIGLQLRDEDPKSILQIIQLAESNKNSYLVQLKMKEAEESASKSRKINFLMMELTDIKNNKGTATLQVRSIKHLQTWLKRDHKLSSELNVKAIDVSAEVLENGDVNWYRNDDDDLNDKPSSQKSAFVKADGLFGSQTNSDAINSSAKNQHMTTDVKKAVFHAIMGAEDYLQAFENCERLSLKKEQQREAIKVLMHCCL